MNHRRPNRSTWTVLPAEGWKGKPPPLSSNPKGNGWTKATKDWWTGIWRSPMATMWIEADVHLLRHLAAVVDQINRGEGTRRC